MALSLPSTEPSDCWRLVGVDDLATPPTISRLLDTVGTRAEWRRAGLPVIFDDRGEVRPVLRGGREYRFETVDGPAAAALRRCQPLVS
jgi:hypothetical protein